MLPLAACATAQPGFQVQPYSTEPLAFGPCPSELTSASEGECALVEVPLDWERAEESERIVLFVRRFRSTADASGTNQVWALDGGPGLAGDVFVDPAIRSMVSEAGYDLYLPTHRGTVYGTQLRCEEQQAPQSDGGFQVTPAEFPACVDALREQWGEGVQQFNSWAAARDVQHLIERAGGASRERVVGYGGSYGSVWGQRLLQMAPEVFDGMWLDSIVDLEASFERADDNSNDAGLTLLQSCAADPGCGQHLSGEVEAMVTEVVAAYRDGNGCGQGERSQAAIQGLFNRLLSNAPWEQALVAPLLVRAHRCATGDREAIEHAFATLEQPPGAPPPPVAYNALLNRHVMLAEMFRYDRSADEVAQHSQTHLFSARADAFMSSIAGSYGEDHRIALPLESPPTNAHVVLWQGGLDPLDRPEWAQQTAERWSESKVTLVEMPQAGHSVVRYAVTADARRCATEMFSAFLADPAAELDRSCLELVPEIDLAATQAKTLEASERWFGTSQPWNTSENE